MSANVSDLPIPQIGDTAVEEKAAEGVSMPVDVVNLHRDERDVRLLLQISASHFVTVLLLLLSLAANAWMYHRRPDRIIVDRRADGDHVVMVNDQAVASGVAVGPDKPGVEDKRRLANEWAMARWAIDPQGREAAIERFLKMMEPHSAAKYVALLKQRGELERERSERMQATWKPQLTTVDSSDRLRVNIVGTQEIDKVVGGVTQHESKQLMFSLKLMPDRESGRAAHNLHTGFRIFDILDLREVATTSASQTLLLQPTGQR
jgi:hypothetical protein